MAQPCTCTASVWHTDKPDMRDQWWCLLAAALAADTMPAKTPSPVLSCAGAPCSTSEPLLSTSRWSQSRMVSILHGTNGCDKTRRSAAAHAHNNSML